MTANCPTPRKRAHDGQPDAERHLSHLRAEGGSVDLHTYRCGCGAWHVGHSAYSLRRRMRIALRSGK